MLFFWYCRHFPARAKAMLVHGVKRALPDFDVDRHFTPSYNPWDQRLCLIPDGDLFEAIKAGRAAVVTDHIDTFTATGVKLRSGAELDADLIVTATGLNLQVLADLAISVDGKRVEPAQTMAYKGMMFSDVPNLALSMGYTNASWTLKCDLTCEYVCRLLNHMQKHGYTQCCPRQTDPTMAKVPMLDFSSGYVQRMIDRFPKQGAKAPWKLYQNYILDILTLGYGALDDGAMEFSTPRRGTEGLQAAG
jgi:monooxygenase